MRLYSWNVNGLRALQRKDALEPFLAEHQPDILCLQEVKAEPDQFQLSWPGHDLWHPAAKKGYSGTGTLSRDAPLTHETLPALHQHWPMADRFGDPWREGRLLTSEYADFYLVNVYTPNVKSDLARLPLRHQYWDPAFCRYVSDLQQRKPVIICGDLNVAHHEIDLAHARQNEGKAGFTTQERSGLDRLLAAGFVDSFRLFHDGPGHYSWWSYRGQARERNVGWRIDYFLVSEALVGKVRAADIHPEISGSDHCPVSIELDFPLAQSSPSSTAKT